jgi:hypothetical protein
MFERGVVTSVDPIRVVLESDTCSVGLKYNVGVPHDVTHED